MKLTITAYGDTIIDVATNVALVIGGLLQGQLSGEDTTPVGSYSYEVDGVDKPLDTEEDWAKYRAEEGLPPLNVGVTSLNEEEYAALKNKLENAPQGVGTCHVGPCTSEETWTCPRCQQPTCDYHSAEGRGLQSLCCECENF